jgi:hypothetical protein
MHDVASGSLSFTSNFLRNANIKLRISDVDLQPKGKENKKYPNLYDQNTWGRCQIWQTQDPEYVPARSSIGPMSPRRTTGSLKALFFSFNAFFGIPCK